MDNEGSALAASRPDLEQPVDCQARPFCRSAPRVAGVAAGLSYLLPSSERPFQYMYQSPPGVSWQNSRYQVELAEILDARTTPAAASIDGEGFELWDAPTSVSDFQDVGAIQTRYYREAEELAKHVTGAMRAVVFDHAVRQREPGRSGLNFGRNGESSALGAVGRVHIDYTEASGPRRLTALLTDNRIAPVHRRFAIVNIWRSIGGKIVDTPLALCSARTVSVTDLAATDLRYNGRTGEMYLVHHSREHRWMYFSEMDRHEALVFKQYDSRVSGVARFTPHSAFDLPCIPANAPLRRSIEIRCLVAYD